MTVSFLDLATSSPGTRTFCAASHTDCTVQSEDNQRHKFQLILKGNTNWQVLPRWSPGKGRHCIFRRRQKIQASLARKTGRLRPNKGRLKVDPRIVLLSREDGDAGAPIEDDGRDGNGESGLVAAEWSSLADPGNAGWS